MMPSDVSYPTCPECESTTVWVKDGERYCWDCFVEQDGRMVLVVLPEGFAHADDIVEEE